MQGRAYTHYWLDKADAKVKAFRVRFWVKGTEHTPRYFDNEPEANRFAQDVVEGGPATFSIPERRGRDY